MSKLGARPLTEREWAMLEHMVDTGGWTEDDPPPFDTDDCAELAIALGHRGFCYVDTGRGTGRPCTGALIAPLGIAYHRWNRTKWPAASRGARKGRIGKQRIGGTARIK